MSKKSLKLIIVLQLLIIGLLWKSYDKVTGRLYYYDARILMQKQRADKLEELLKKHKLWDENAW